MCMKWFKENKEWGMIPLRIALAIVFIAHGASKLFGGLEGTGQFFASVGIPLASIFAVVVAIVELFGGIAVLLGLGTRYAAALLSVVMIVAILVVHIKGGYELDLALLGGTLALLFHGAGPLSLDGVWCKKK